jgi:predicted AlkP superfamily phosphohydrolase/phosphomutase
VRINLRGRELEGIVPPSQYDTLCERLVAGLMSFRDAETGAPIVAEVRRPVEVFGPGERDARVPDLVVRWAESPAAPHAALVSEEYGRIERATPGRIPNGRSGNHRAYGFLMVRGAGIEPGTTLPEFDILDVAPTLYDIFDLPRPPRMHGQSFIERLWPIKE